MKLKEHKFTLVVKTVGTRKSAENAVLFVFAKRDPDGCEFHLKRRKEKTREMAALAFAMESLRQISEMPRQRRARNLAGATMKFLETQLGDLTT
jgi:hypothetical protein